MTQDQAGALAWLWFWQRTRADEMAPGVDVSLVDWVWNSGGAVAEIQHHLGVKVDGIVGPVTLAAIGGRPDADFIQALCEWRISYYDVNGFRQRFPGLYTRATDCRDLSLTLVGRSAA